MTEFELDETPLVDAMDFASDLHSITILLNSMVSRNIRITCRSTPGETLKQALTRILTPHRLDYALVEDGIEIRPISGGWR